jgi:deazaflavin-dependent oxidoreductase (nitroreductase family)
MATLNPETENTLRLVFKRFNPFMIGLFRLGLGWAVNIWPAVGGRIMVITHTGRKSGLPRRTPVNYAPIEGDLYCTAGFGSISDWYRNILANPRVEIWLPRGWWRGVVEDISQDPRRIPLLREVIIASGVVGPMMGVNPPKMSDAEFDRVTSSYRLLRVRLQERLSGPGGPGDLAWVWLPLALIVALFVFMQRRK